MGYSHSMIQLTNSIWVNWLVLGEYSDTCDLSKTIGFKSPNTSRFQSEQMVVTVVGSSETNQSDVYHADLPSLKHGNYLTCRFFFAELDLNISKTVGIFLVCLKTTSTISRVSFSSTWQFRGEFCSIFN